MKFIIDGYNVIHQLKQLQGKKLRSQREGLIALLEMAQAQDKKLKDLTVVFDGQLNVYAPRTNSSVKIVFSQGKTADQKIKKIVESSHHARDIAIVSDDRQIHSFAGRARAKKVSVAEFLKLITQAGTKTPSFKLDHKKAQMINQELEKIWLKH